MSKKFTQTYKGKAGSVSYSPRRGLTVRGASPYLLTHPRNCQVAELLAGNPKKLRKYLKLLYREGCKWERMTRHIQDVRGPRF